jgi:hypothetical protein
MDGGSGRGELGEIEIVVGRRLNLLEIPCWNCNSSIPLSFVLLD